MRVKALRLRAARESRALSQQELSTRSGVAKSTIVRIENGTDAHPRTVRKLAEALEMEPKELMGEGPA